MTDNQNNGGKWKGSRLRIVAWAVAALIVLIPLLAMQFTDEVNWDVADFIILGMLLLGSGLSLELAARYSGNRPFRYGVMLAVLAAFLLFWINGAVGIIGDDSNDVNMIFHGVLAVALIGVFVARFEPKRMAIAMYAAAGAQVLVFLIALVAGWGFVGPITMLFTALWLGSGQLFKKAAAELATEGTVAEG